MRLLAHTTLFAKTAMRLWADTCVVRPTAIKPEGSNSSSLGQKRLTGG